MGSYGEYPCPPTPTSTPNPVPQPEPHTHRQPNPDPTPTGLPPPTPCSAPFQASAWESVCHTFWRVSYSTLGQSLLLVSEHRVSVAGFDFEHAPVSPQHCASITRQVAALRGPFGSLIKDCPVQQFVTMVYISSLVKLGAGGCTPLLATPNPGCNPTKPCPSCRHGKQSFSRAIPSHQRSHLQEGQPHVSCYHKSPF